MTLRIPAGTKVAISPPGQALNFRPHVTRKVIVAEPVADHAGNPALMLGMVHFEIDGFTVRVKGALVERVEQ